MSKVARRLMPLAAGAWITLLAGGLVAPKAALAGCGHYAVAASQLEAERLSVYELEILSEASLRGDAGPSRLPSDGRLPCSGPSCSNNPGSPLVPPAPAPAGPLRAEAWACIALSPPLFVLPSLASLAEQSTGRPVHLGSPPDRPPRSA
jgi:hypothetical protein